MEMQLIWAAALRLHSWARGDPQEENGDVASRSITRVPSYLVLSFFIYMHSLKYIRVCVYVYLYV